MSVFATESLALHITDVRHAPRRLESTGDTALVQFRLSHEAYVVLTIFDGRHRAVREVASDGTLAAGAQALRWDGRDFANRPVPSEAYVYTLRATSKTGETAVWDIVNETGGDNFRVRDFRWDPAAGEVHYTLKKPGRVRIRVGIGEGGPLLRTLVDWVARDAGEQSEAWDGLDASGVRELSSDRNLRWLGEAFALGTNTLLVGRADQVSLIEDLPESSRKRALGGAKRKRMYDYASRPIETRRDFHAWLDVPEDLERQSDGSVVVSGLVSIRLGASQHDAQILQGDRFEAVFFVDNRRVFESEVGFLPMTWRWDPSGLNAGTHYLTANLRGYEGYFGMVTLKVLVRSAIHAGTERNR